MKEEPYIESAKEVAGKAIGKHGLIYITIIVAMGVGASIVLEESKMAAVMGLLGASLTALISMMNGVAGSSYTVNNYNTNDKTCALYIAATGAAWVVAWFVGHWTASAEL